MYSADRNSYSQPSLQLVADANARMMSTSAGFHRDGGLTAAEQLSIAGDIENLRNVDESLSFTEYCNELKKQNPEDAEYIDYCA